MKYWWLFLGLGLTDSPALASRRALLVGISTYPSGRTGTSAARDHYYMMQMLRQQQFDDITTLADHEATAQGIRDALAQLLGRCQAGDKVVFHYAGHGTQLPDQIQGDEADHRDEALVPYDAPRLYKTVRGQPDPFIRDDELAIFLSQLRDKLGPAGHILLLVDACHAGTLTRGQARLRTDHYTGGNTLGHQERGSGWFDAIPAFNRIVGESGKVILMAGSQAGEANYETIDDEKQAVGSLTYAFSRAMSSITTTDTYQSLFDRVKTELRRKAPEQMPTLEGDRGERVWNGEVVSASGWDMVRRLTKKTLRVAKGLLAGYGVGSVVRISRDDGPAVTGQVVTSSPFESRIQLQDSLPVQDSLPLRVKLISQVLPELPLRLTLRHLTPFQKDQVLSALADLPNVQLVSQEADWIIEPSAQQLCLLQATNGQRIICQPAATPGSLIDPLALISQMTLLRTIALPEATLQATIQLQNARLSKDGQTLRDTLPTATYRGWNVFHPGQQAWLRVRNAGNAPFYFALIDLQPDARATVLLPNDAYASAELYLEPGQQAAFPVSRFAPPYGQETYKLMLTSAPVDWRLPLLTRGENARLANLSNPFSHLLEGPVRGQDQPNLLLNEVGLATLNFWIKPTP